MPAFSFEKLSPPVHPEPVQVGVVRPQRTIQSRSILLQMLDRLTESRLRRTDRDISQDQRKP
jgi:hypothetical protein